MNSPFFGLFLFYLMLYAIEVLLQELLPMLRASTKSNAAIMIEDEQDKKMSQLIAKCWSDDGFKRRIMAEPN